MSQTAQVATEAPWSSHSNPPWKPRGHARSCRTPSLSGVARLAGAIECQVYDGSEHHRRGTARSWAPGLFWARARPRNACRRDRGHDAAGRARAGGAAPPHGLASRAAAKRRSPGPARCTATTCLDVVRGAALAPRGVTSLSPRTPVRLPARPSRLRREWRASSPGQYRLRAWVTASRADDGTGAGTMRFLPQQAARLYLHASTIRRACPPPAAGDPPRRRAMSTPRRCDLLRDEVRRLSQARPPVRRAARVIAMVLRDRSVDTRVRPLLRARAAVNRRASTSVGAVRLLATNPRWLRDAEKKRNIRWRPSARCCSPGTPGWACFSTTSSSARPPTATDEARPPASPGRAMPPRIRRGLSHSRGLAVTCARGPRPRRHPAPSRRLGPTWPPCDRRAASFPRLHPTRRDRAPGSSGE